MRSSQKVVLSQGWFLLLREHLMISRDFFLEEKWKQ